tara:strand:+ start:61495 stop:62190 length:696 start_codon:yes stop_codon:yes gene_type:complete
MKKLFLVIFLSIGSVAGAFETTSGHYVGQQDVLQLLTDVFYGDALPANTYDLLGCISYREPRGGSREKDLYELGFNNIDSGERLIQSPDAAYVLHFDTCIGKIVKQLFSYYTEANVKKLISETGYQELEKWRAAYYPTAQNSPGWSYLYTLSSSTFTQVDAKVLSQEVKEKLIDIIFLKVFGSANLIPKDYLDESKKELGVQASADGAMKISDFIASAYKKAIINDYLLKY